MVGEINLVSSSKICSTIFYTRPSFVSSVNMKEYTWYTKKSRHKLTCVFLQTSSRKTCRRPLIRCAFIESRAHCVSFLSKRVQCSSTILMFYSFSSVSSFGLSFLLNSTKRQIDGYPGFGSVASSSGIAEEALVDFPFSICRGIVFIENESTARKIRSRAPRTRVDHGGFGSFAMTPVVVVVAMGRSLRWLDVWLVGR